MASKVHVSEDLSDSADSEIDSHDADSESGASASDAEQPEDRLQADSEGEAEHEETEESSKTGLADVFSKILKKKTLRKGPAVLAKGQTDKEILAQKKKRKKEEESQEGDAKPKRVKEEEEESDHENDQKQRLKRKLWEEMGHVKPDVLDRNTERNLQKTATRGVVQLFNAVRMQQKSLDEKLKDVGTSESKREKVMQSMTKGRFLDMLKSDRGSGSNVMNVTAEGSVKTTPKPEKSSKKAPSTAVKERETEKPAWGILRDDFMMGAQMKDWDKHEDDSDNDDQNDNDELGSGDSDSDT